MAESRYKLLTDGRRVQRTEDGGRSTYLVVSEVVSVARHLDRGFHDLFAV